MEKQEIFNSGEKKERTTEIRRETDCRVLGNEFIRRRNGRNMHGNENRTTTFPGLSSFYSLLSSFIGNESRL